VRFVNGYYELIAGHRRLMAIKALNIDRAPVYILDIDDKQAAQFTIIENIQRKDLNSIDLALSLQNIIKSFSLKHEDCAISLGKSRVYVTNLLRLLNLDPVTIKAVQNNSIQESHARLLLTVKDVEKRQSILNLIITKKLSVKELDIYLRKLCGKKVKSGSSFPPYKKQQQELSSFFNKPVKVFRNTIQIKFKDVAGLKDLFQQFQLPYDDD
jgi:ParB family chromosome partitioning protein